MDIRELTGEGVPEQGPKRQGPPPVRKRSADPELNWENLKEFFRLTGGSFFYCLSAAFVAYGIVKLMGPVLSADKTLGDALPGVFTLGVYELALLGVMILIVSRKVVDDAISLVVLVAMFLVATSMALGSVADKGVGACFFLGLGGIALAVGKLCAMRRFARIPFRALSVAGVVLLMACNYWGPVLLARSIANAPAQEAARRGLWLSVWLVMFMGAGFVIAEAMRTKVRREGQEKGRAAFLQTRAMVYVFALILVAASGVHQYSMAFTFALERVLGDFVPVTFVGTVLLLEIVRHWRQRFGAVEIIISCVPLVVMLLAIWGKSVLASGEFGLGLICYPPVILGLSGLVIAGLGLYHRWYPLLVVAVLYGLAVVLTSGFSPEHPHDLNMRLCFGILVVGLLAYGLVIRNEYVCLAGLAVLCLGLSMSERFWEFAESQELTVVGGQAGVWGLGSVALCLLFGSRVHRAIRVFGALCVAGCAFDYLPISLDWRYAVVVTGTVVVVAGLWLRARDIAAIVILWAPSVVKVCMLIEKHLVHWRFVILGFLTLGVGMVVSLLKHRIKERTDAEEP